MKTWMVMVLGAVGLVSGDVWHYFDDPADRGEILIKKWFAQAPPGGSMCCTTYGENGQCTRYDKCAVLPRAAQHPSSKLCGEAYGLPPCLSNIAYQQPNIHTYPGTALEWSTGVAWSPHMEIRTGISFDYSKMFTPDWLFTFCYSAKEPCAEVKGDRLIELIKADQPRKEAEQGPFPPFPPKCGTVFGLPPCPKPQKIAQKDGDERKKGGGKEPAVPPCPPGLPDCKIGGPQPDA